MLLQKRHSRHPWWSYVADELGKSFQIRPHKALASPAIKNYHPFMLEHDLQPERTIYSVSELNLNVRNLLESEFPRIWVEAEVSNLAMPASGHIYFSLKDSHAQVSCAMFKSRKQLLKFKPENGQQVLVRARVSLYEPRGNYQLIIEHMEEAGDGALRRAFEELKSRLAAAGLFDEIHKQALPELPQRIGVVTSATGAAIRDVLSVLQRRFPAIPVLIYPVPVQGAGAATEIARTLRTASARKDCDVLLLVRGGGSLEDLWAFNEEIVAHAIVDSEIPIVCGVGHEIDITIADFAADVRAPTPSAAAELISPDQETYLQTFSWYQERLHQLLSNKIRRLAEQIDWLRKRLQQQHPLSYLQQQSQRLDELEQRVNKAWQQQLRNSESNFKHLLHRLLSSSPTQQINRGQQEHSQFMQRLERSLKQHIMQKKQHLAAVSRTLHAISPLETLSRGYAIATTENGTAITNYQQVQVGDKVQVQLHKGQIFTRVEKSQGTKNLTPDTE